MISSGILAVTRAFADSSSNQGGTDGDNMQVKKVEYDAPYIHHRTIRFGETDAATIVYTARFFDYALDAIDAWYADVLTVSLYSLNVEHNVSCPFVHASID